ncbi:HD domain-containing protein [Aspergillus novofumigatus IBT 16806]|uniref:HD domain-containing protein n=1 Tax=Aspergillus novofumigatus (strain IBT 16806) TaxID=1392255 RepID=A0A2I1C3N6_ASPN1|nr:uncharacterized protein P174DRAFT_264792 [Aspergillus novofumigatus IBT 16806]PKX92236.1 hypothetical protein P174DRAFT_264792 [Aspergillus novofumigatus IBT 16806]
MPPSTPLEKANRLIDCLEQHGQGDYIGESISQLEHSLQAAHRAKKAGATDDLMLAALLHDIGRIIPLDSTREIKLRMQTNNNNQSVGRIGHETLGAEYGETVCRLVGSHVPAKRYLTAVDSAYYDSLSAASKMSLEVQGGPFSGAELAAFEADPLREVMVLLRLWDDRAKVPGIEGLTPRAGSI